MADGSAKRRGPETLIVFGLVWVVLSIAVVLWMTWFGEGASSLQGGMLAGGLAVLVVGFYLRSRKSRR